MSRLALVSPEGRVLTDNEPPAPKPEESTEPTTIVDLAKMAFEEAKRTSTKGIS